MPFCACCCFGRKNKKKVSENNNPAYVNDDFVGNGEVYRSPQETVDESARRLSDIEQKLKEAESNRSQLQQMLSDESEKLYSAQLEIRSLKAQIGVVEERDICLQAEWGQKIEDRERKITILSRKLENNNNSNGTNESMEEKNREIAELIAKLEAKDQEFANSAKKWEEKNREMFELTNELADKNKKLDEVIEKLDEKDQKLKLLAKKDDEEIVKTAEVAETLRISMPSPANPKKRRHAVVERRNVIDVAPTAVKKSLKMKEFLFEALRQNEMLRYLSDGQLREIVVYMKREGYQRNHTLIKEGEEGNCLYVLETGQCQVVKNGNRIAVLGGGQVFGEIAIVHKTRRTATVQSLTQVNVWYVERAIYRYVMETVAKTRTEELRKLVENTPLSRFSLKKLAKIADAIIEEQFEMGAYIVRQGEIGRTFYIIKEGEVKVTEIDEKSPGRQENLQTTLSKGNYFGETALRMDGSKRTANVIAHTEKVICLALDKKDFDHLIGVNVPKGSLTPANSTPLSSRVSAQEKPTPRLQIHRRTKLSTVSLSDLELEATLGAGAFGRVDLVKLPKMAKVFALKRIKKHVILESGQQQNVFREKEIMMECRCDFIVGMFRTFKDKRYIYMLMDACLGGELWTLLKKEKRFPNSRGKFYAACVVEALDYLQRSKVVHRDLKLENLLLDENGYLQLADFGSAKILEPGEKTWSFCGTPHYMAPEIIWSQGYDIAVDYWSLGVLIFELLNGYTPFDAGQEDEIFRLASKGIGAVTFPNHMTHAAKDLIRRLCRERPTGRLGYLKNGVQDIRNHTWFNGFDWTGLQNCRLEPDYIPTVKDGLDTRNFTYDEPPEDDRLVPIDLSNWDENF